jgi:hypothetical protein
MIQPIFDACAEQQLMREAASFLVNHVLAVITPIASSSKVKANVNAPKRTDSVTHASTATWSMNATTQIVLSIQTYARMAHILGLTAELNLSRSDERKTVALANA